MQENVKMGFYFLANFHRKMKPKRPQEVVQNDLFKTRLDEFLNPKHELYRLASKIDWARLDEEFGPFFEAEQGAPALSTRLIAGLHYLKHAEGLSDEAVVKRWVENGYWQYFCGETFFQHEVPCHPTSLTKWRQRIGEAGCEWLLLLTIEAGVATRTVKKTRFSIGHRRYYRSGKSGWLSDGRQVVRKMPSGAGQAGWTTPGCPCDRTTIKRHRCC